MDRHDRGVLFLAAKPAACLRLDDHRLLVREFQGPFERSMYVVGALQGSDDTDYAVRLGDRDRSLRLDVELLLQADPERALHYLHTLEILHNLAFADLDGAQHLGGLFERVDG